MDWLQRRVERAMTPKRLLVIFTLINMMNYLDRGIVPVSMFCGVAAMQECGLRSPRYCVYSR